MVKNKGFSLVEVMVCIAILASLFVGVISLNIYCLDLIETARNITIASNTARTQIEEIKNMGFDDIRSTYVAAAGGASQSVLLNSPVSVDGVMRVEATDVNGSDQNLLDLRVVVCWRQRGGRIVGEDNGAGGGIALDGILNGTEDVNGDGELNSPVELTSAIMKRQ